MLAKSRTTESGVTHDSEPPGILSEPFGLFSHYETICSPDMFVFEDDREEHGSTGFSLGSASTGGDTFSSISFESPVSTEEYFGECINLSAFYRPETWVYPQLLDCDVFIDNSIKPIAELPGKTDDRDWRGWCQTCSKSFKDLKSHMFTHQAERPEKCLIKTCEYHIKGFARKYGQRRHMLTHYDGVVVCHFCPGGGSVDEKSFNRVDVFKRHLASVHSAKISVPTSRRSRKPTVQDGDPKKSKAKLMGKCSICNTPFQDVQSLYDHLDNCVVGHLKQLTTTETSDAKHGNHYSKEHDANRAPSLSPEANGDARLCSNFKDEDGHLSNTNLTPREIERFQLLEATPYSQSNINVTQTAGIHKNLQDFDSISIDGAKLWPVSSACSLQQEELRKEEVQNLIESPRSDELTTPVSSSSHFEDSTHSYSPSASYTSDLTVTVSLDTKSCGFITKLASAIVERCLNPSTGSFRSCAEAQSDSSGSASFTNLSETMATSQSTSSKRQRQKDKGDDDGKDENEGETPAKKKRREAATQAKLWACPYNKFDPTRYSERNQSEKAYRKCASATLTDIASVKQHLRRTHREPEFYCGRCFVSFVRKTDLLQHNNVICEPGAKRFEEMMTDDQYKSIPGYLPNTHESWYIIFEKLFGDIPAPTSPYVTLSDPATLQHFIEMFRWVGPREFLSLARSLEPLQSNVSLRRIIEEAFETAFPEYLHQVRCMMNDRVPSDVALSSTHISSDQINSLSSDISADMDYHTSEPLNNLSVNSDGLSFNQRQVEEGFAAFNANLFGKIWLSADQFSGFDEHSLEFRDGENHISSMPQPFDPIPYQGHV